MAKTPGVKISNLLQLKNVSSAAVLNLKVIKSIIKLAIQVISTSEKINTFYANL